MKKATKRKQATKEPRLTRRAQQAWSRDAIAAVLLRCRELGAQAAAEGDYVGCAALLDTVVNVHLALHKLD